MPQQRQGHEQHPVVLDPLPDLHSSGSLLLWQLWGGAELLEVS